MSKAIITIEDVSTDESNGAGRIGVTLEFDPPVENNDSPGTAAQQAAMTMLDAFKARMQNDTRVAADPLGSVEASLKTLEAFTGWVGTDFMLPEFGVPVLFVWRDRRPEGIIGYGCLNADGTWTDDATTDRNGEPETCRNVTYWMRIPNYPGEGEK